jgi:hypothetical protein
VLGHYLAGLIEGDGSIIVPKMDRNEKGKLLYPKLHPYYITGFSDAEGSFSVLILKRPARKIGWGV